jgi:hypothetical protein
MIVYDGTYRLPYQADQQHEPRSRWTCAWQVRIINLELSQPNVRHMRPMIVVVNQIGRQPCLASCVESIGKKISRDFRLDIARVIWVENFPDNLKQWYVAALTPKSGFGPDANYHIQWRPIRPEEINVIKPFIPDVDPFS